MQSSNFVSRLAGLGAVVAFAATLGACGNLTGSKPSSANFTDTLTVYALNGTPSTALTGLSFLGGQAIPVSTGFGFDVAFDLDGSGATTLYTVRKVAGQLSNTNTVALQKVATAFDELTTAPRDGYVSDSLLTVAIGDVIAVRTYLPSACSYTAPSYNMYSKLEILDIDPTARTVKTRFTVNPNCGFYSLVPSGVPKN